MFALLTMTAIPMAFVMMVLAIVKVIGMSNQIVQVTFIMIQSDLVTYSPHYKHFGSWETSSYAKFT